jgi:multidrug efflux pump
MNLSAPFVRRPVATTLLTLGLALAGLVGFTQLPVAPLPQVDFPTISVQASLPGASPETMAATVATPLERSLGRIAGVTEMTSQSTAGATRVTLQFDLDRNIDGAARDVQAAINAARTLLPTGLPSNPTYRKVNPADAPVMILSLTSDTMSKGEMYDAASTILAQKLAQVEGVGQVNLGGSSLPAVRVELNPHALDRYGIGLEDVRAAIVAANPNRPKGIVEDADRTWQIAANDQAQTARDYLPLIVAYRQGAAVRLADVAAVVDAEQDLRNAGLANGRPAVLLLLYRQPGANIIATVDRVRDLLPQLTAALPAAIQLEVVMDRTPTIRASLHEVELTLALSVVLVVLVVFLFLGDVRSTLIPSVAVPLSLIGTCGVMYLCDYSLDNLSLMALAVATGFVVDDAIVVLENVSRHLERGTPPIEATLRGVREVGFTVVSMSLSLVAVFIPILLMGGIVGRLFREFGVTLAAAVLVSLVVSLTTTPMMCARLLRPGTAAADRLRLGPRAFAALQRGYVHSLDWALRHRLITLLLLLATIAFNIHLYAIVPKGFFPQQDTGRLVGSIQADQSISFQAMQQKLAEFIGIVRADPAVANVVGFTGGGQRNGGFMFIALKPLAERQISADQVIARLRPRLFAAVAGASLFLQPVQDIRMGGRPGGAQYQYTLLSADLEELRTWEPQVRAILTELPELADVNTDQQERGLQTTLSIDRDTLARLGLTMRQVDATLNDAFGQRQVSTIYHPLNQYHVVMELAPAYWQSPVSLQTVHVVVPGGAAVPLSAFSHTLSTTAPLAVNHQGQFAASTLSFNLPPGVALGTAQSAIAAAIARSGIPSSVQGNFQGIARVFQDSLASQPWLILAALIAVYVTLGVLYESTIHPITILSTLPSAGVGALLALLAMNIDFSIIALIGIILLIGIVKKNAIIMIDFAVESERRAGLSPLEAIRQACLLRLRPILMTTLAALLGALPLALGLGEGGELRRPLGISIVGGLLVSQLLTLYTTPVVYLYLDRLRLWVRSCR